MQTPPMQTNQLPELPDVKTREYSEVESVSVFIDTGCTMHHQQILSFPVGLQGWGLGGGGSKPKWSTMLEHHTKHHTIHQTSHVELVGVKLKNCVELYTRKMGVKLSKCHHDGMCLFD